MTGPLHRAFVGVLILVAGCLTTTAGFIDPRENGPGSSDATTDSTTTVGLNTDPTTTGSTSASTSGNTSANTSATTSGGAGPTTTATDPGTTGATGGAASSGTSGATSTSGETTGTTSCGDGVASGDEDCDGPDLNGQRCQDRGYEVGGTLTCAGDCSFDTTRCLGCGDSLPPATGACPPACDRCKGPRCLIQCPGNPACGSKTITCPAGWDCTVVCNGQNACKAHQIQCPDGLDCDVTCNLEDACQDAVVHCNNANCSLDCQSGLDVCKATTFNCGPNTGRATCGDGDADFVFNDNNTACSCTNVGCG